MLVSALNFILDSILSLHTAGIFKFQEITVSTI